VTKYGWRARGRKGDDKAGGDRCGDVSAACGKKKDVKVFLYVVPSLTRCFYSAPNK
jgi:hypothetical protein